MSRDGSGIYHTPPGTPGITDTTIASTPYNSYVADVEQDLNLPRPIVAGGTGANNARDAMTSLQGDVAYQVVTNYDAYPFVSGSFYSAAGATSAPVAGHAFTGICYSSDPAVVPPALPANQNYVIEARDESDTVFPGRKYVREKKAGVWINGGAWTLDGRTTVGSSEGISGVAADMFYGLTGTAPASSFIVNTKADVSGTSLLSIAKGGSVTISSLPGSPVTLQLSHATGAFGNNIYGLANAQNRWVMQLGNETAEGGSNAGSDFVVQRYSDAGSFLGSPFTIVRGTGNAQFAQTLTVGVSGTTGTYYFGNSGTKALSYDGTQFNLAGGGLWVANGSLFAQNTVVSGFASPAAGSYVFGSDGTKHLDYSGNYFTFVGGAIQLGTGFSGRTGVSGNYAASPYTHNFQWTGSLLAWVDTTNVGTITLTSDYRIKKDVIDLPGMWDTVKALRPIKYTQATFSPPSHIAYAAEQKTKDAPQVGPLYEADDIERWGFIAHELQETILPSMASGVKDSPDTVQSLNLAPIVAALTKALQEAMARIEALEAK